LNDTPRLIEVAFPLKQASLDSVHEKNVRHGHISTLHIWPARRPLAACRAALIATLLPDPGTPEERRKLCEKIGGKVVQKVEKKPMPNGKTVERIKEETEGGILHWKRETENADDLQWFRDEIRKAYGGRAPKVLDPFAGGGAIPLEAMRLGCEATAIDINPVAWFILKCTLEYPQKLAGQKRPLPEFILRNRDVMESFFKAQGIKGAALRKQLEKLGFNGTNGKPAGFQDQRTLAGLHFDDHSLDADLAWHVRAWGEWVLDRTRRDLARFYPTYADFEPLKKSDQPYEARPMQLVPAREDGTPDIDKLNAEFTADYLADRRNPRWVAKPTVAYLWARSVKCKNCRATVPLLKTRWLCKKDRKRVLLTMESDAERTGIIFGVQNDVPAQGGNAAQRREHDKRIGQGTMSRAGARCPCCPTIVTSEDIRLEGQAGRLLVVPTAVVVDGQSGQEYRLPTELEIELADQEDGDLLAVYSQIPFGIPTEPIPEGASRVGGGSPFTVYQYGFTTWGQLFRPRQLLSLGTIVVHSRGARDAMKAEGYPDNWIEAVCAALAVGIDKFADRSSAFCRWDAGYTKVSNTFARFALPILWDFCEANPLSDTTGNYRSCVSWVVEVIQHAMSASCQLADSRAICTSAIKGPCDGDYDLCLTDPPYYDAIPYSDLMDFFYVWLRRSLHGLTPELDRVFCGELSPKWDHEHNDGELIDDASRYDGDNRKSKAAYEDGMARAFLQCHRILRQNGRLVVVFAHKNPDAWESLVSAIIKAGFVVDGSWPVQTEMGNRTRALASAALASSVWLVCKKRAELSRPGWDNKVLEEMRANIVDQLRNFWDAGIRGPDFVWAATGPAMEAFSKYPIVKKADEPGQFMSITEFLHHVRRMVVDFVVGRVLSGDGGEDMAAADRLDDVTAYYLLHRHDFGFTDAPVGGCILYAISCGLSDSELADTWDILSRTGGSADEDEEEQADPDAEAEPEADEGSGSKVKLKTWAQRNRKNMGYEAPGGRPVPLIDRLHRLMHLWRAGESAKVDEYLDDYGLRRNELFRRLLQSLVELSPAGSDERATLESISNHVGAKGAKPKETMPLPGMDEE
jgi:adenine-specific DNA methylase